MSNEKMREEFELWAVNYGVDDYESAWQAWKASRAALCVELPKLEEPSGVIGIGFNVAKGMFIAKFMELGVSYK